MDVETRENPRTKPAEAIAIVGLGCRLPGNVSTIDQLIAVLREGRDCITEVPADRWDVDAFYDPDPLTPGKTYVRHGGFIADVKYFDAAFFGISDSEAARMDPQQRLILETVWHALENAGQAAEELARSNTGVFLAMMNTNNYWQLKTVFEGLAGITAYDAMGDATSIAAGRISHFLGLEGPCLTLDTACSGSMVALHLARQSILAGECDSAIVAGVSAILTPHVHVAFSKVGLMSRSGHCKAFDEAADGYIRGEGCVALLLRRQSLAVARRDHILASVVASAINQDGRTPAITAPNGQTQESVMRLALTRVGINPNEVGYVEAHGTGTPVGDPIEMSALVNVYGKGRSDPLYVGSAKSNFGHIESAAGLLGVAKAALSLEQQLIFPSIHFNRLNPNIDLGDAPVRVPTTGMRWPSGERPRLAAINSFGYSGTNAHVVLEETQPRQTGQGTPRLSELIVLSAKSTGGLQELADRWSSFLDDDNSFALGDIAFTAATGRTHFRHRLAMVAHGKSEASEKLQIWREGRVPKAFAVGQSAGARKKVAFVFTGQGSQYPGMARELYNTEPRFKAAIDRCAGLMDDDLGTPLQELLFGANSAALLQNTRYVQPALVAVEYALADLLTFWGIEPDYVIGHSVGEIVAATVAGALELDDAVRLVLARGRLMGGLPRNGKMLALDATAEQARQWLAGKEAEISIAAVNGPTSVVLSGSAGAVDAVAQLAAAAGQRVKELEVSHAFHSPLMEPILDELEQIAGRLRISRGRIPVISNLTGEPLGEQLPARYWSAHVRQPVLFHKGICKLVEAGCSVFVEIGPHPALSPMIAAAVDGSKARCVPTLMRDQQDVSHILQALGSLYVNGAPVRFERLFANSTEQRVPLPLYPFRRDHHWIRFDQGFIEPSKLAGETAPKPTVELHPLLGRATIMEPRRAVFDATVAATQPWVDHRIMGSTVFPGTGYLEMAARGFSAANGREWQSIALRDVTFERPLVLAYGRPKKLNMTLESRSSNGTSHATFTISAGNNEIHCRGRVAAATDAADKVSVEEELGRMQSKLEVGPFYGELRKRSFEYGASFSTIRELWIGRPGSGEAIARISPSPRQDGTDHPFTYTTALDGCLQVFGAALRTLDANDPSGAFVPHSIQSVMLRNKTVSQLWSHARVRTNGDGRALVATIRVVTGEGDTLADIDGLELRPIAKFSLVRGGGETRTSEYVSETREQLVARLGKLPQTDRAGVLAKWLIVEVKEILGQAAEEIDLDNLDPSTAFIEIGLDSLLITELQRRIQEKLQFRFKPMQGLDYQSAESLAEYILNDVLFAETPVATRPPAKPEQRTDLQT
jgi:acyl transferase domain-containing protein